MFSFFKKSESISCTDKVWKTRAALQKGLTAEGLEGIRQHEFVVILFWFTDHRKSFVEYCQSQNIPVAGLEEFTSPATPVILITDAHNVTNSLSSSVKLSEQAKKSKIVLILDGHYPLIEKESVLLEKVKGWNPGNTRLTFCQSLDSAFFKQFVGDKLSTLLQQLGLKEDECLEHGMITKSITRAREKISKAIFSEQASRSEIEWFSKNKILS